MAKKLSQGRVLTAMHRGAQILMDNNKEKTTFRLSTNQALVDKGLFDDLLLGGLIEPNNDCLPGFGQSQSYSIKRNLA